MKFKLLVISSILFFTACSTKLYVPNESNVNKQMTATVEEMVQGRNIYSTKCSTCHKLANPESRNMMEWSGVMEKMAPKAKLSKEEFDLVMKYLSNHNGKK